MRHPELHSASVAGSTQTPCLLALSAACRIKIKITEQPLCTIKCHCTICRNFRSMRLSNAVFEQEFSWRGSANQHPCSLKSGEEIDTLDTDHPVVGFYRNGTLEVVEGEECIGWVNTRGDFPFYTGVKRGFCKECHTPGIIEYMRGFHWLLFLGISVSYIGRHEGYDRALQEEHMGHFCYNTATPKAQEVCRDDGKPKFGFWASMLYGTIALYFRCGPLWYAKHKETGTSPATSDSPLLKKTM